MILYIIIICNIIIYNIISLNKKYITKSQLYEMNFSTFILVLIGLYYGNNNINYNYLTLLLLNWYFWTKYFANQK